MFSIIDSMAESFFPLELNANILKGHREINSLRDRIRELQKTKDQFSQNTLANCVLTCITANKLLIDTLRNLSDKFGDNWASKKSIPRKKIEKEAMWLIDAQGKINKVSSTILKMVEKKKNSFLTPSFFPSSR